MMQRALLVFIVLGLAACSSLRGVPLQHDAPIDFGAATELSGALLYERGDGSLGHYLLALRVDGRALDLAVVTPQAVPLYRVQALDDSRDVMRKLAGQGEPDADELLRALRLMYGDPGQLAALLQPGWTLRETAGGRELYRGEGAPALVIEYDGKPPWYREARLKDTDAGTMLSVHWLDY